MEYSDGPFADDISDHAPKRGCHHSKQSACWQWQAEAHAVVGADDGERTHT
jgi:hypothetical protein